MALKQLHLNDSAKTPIEPVISTESIPNKGVTNEKIADGAIDYRTLKGDLPSKLTLNCVARKSGYNGVDKIIDDNKGEYISFTVEKTGLQPSKTTLSVNKTNVTINGDEIALQKNVISVGQQAQQAMNDSITAKQDASSALTKATNAESKATTAENNASSALSKANTAVSTAGSASSLAAEAKKSADSAGTKANELGAVVSALKTKVDKINTDLMVVVSDVSTAQATAEASASQAQSAYNLANDKQDKLVSGNNIKTINGVSLLGKGDVPVTSGSGTTLYIHNIKQDGGPIFYLLSTTNEPYQGFTDLFSKGKLLGMLTSYGVVAGTYFNDPRLGAMLAFLKFDFDTQTMVIDKSILMSKTIIDSNIRPL